MDWYISQHRIASNDAAPMPFTFEEEQYYMGRMDAVLFHERIKESVDTTLRCSNDLVYLPGQKEQESRRRRLEKGVPYRPDQINYLMEVGDKVGVSFEIDPQPYSAGCQ